MKQLSVKYRKIFLKGKLKHPTQQFDLYLVYLSISQVYRKAVLRAKNLERNSIENFLQLTD